MRKGLDIQKENGAFGVSISTLLLCVVIRAVAADSWCEFTYQFYRINHQQRTGTSTDSIRSNVVANGPDCIPFRGFSLLFFTSYAVLVSVRSCKAEN